MEFTETVAFRLDRQTRDFLEALRRDDHVNISAWVRAAIRKHAGLDAVPAATRAEPKAKKRA